MGQQNKKSNVKSPIRNFRQIYKIAKSDDMRFILGTGMKITSVAFIVTVFIIYMFWVVLSYNNVFFEANGFLNIDELRQAYFDFILHKTLFRLHYFLAFFIGLFLSGIYVGKILLRPFEIIAKYCDESIEDENVTYNPDLFSDFKLLTRFSEYFFEHIKEARAKQKLSALEIPQHFTRIHGPVFDRVFFFHFTLFISIITLVSSFVILETTVSIYESIIELSIQSLKNQGSAVRYFLKNQIYIFESVQWISIVSIIISYLLLSFHLYSKVSGAVFGYFSTMRTYLKGNHYARVHLVGYRHVRPYSRALNRYLDFIQKSFGNSNQTK